jgi:hypothetical protein
MMIRPITAKEMMQAPKVIAKSLDTVHGFRAIFSPPHFGHRNAARTGWPCEATPAAGGRGGGVAELRKASPRTEAA